ncbi:peptidoglycan-binding protein [Streptomyces sp. NBC_01446]|uniref:peptidoglycan-binding domain-containing protein n=1 Tax=Streptomyces sp. NBC_01446 TaxID=2903870 RepID=UPI002255F26D|nr:peptidoglycan-binding domain-containing protein [Streptomyces sp. NBC_01446]MCX4647764.1 peptidoglycan-binding protein [Streptomyces sp. NBC_01446]
MSAQRCPLCGSEPIADQQPACGCATSAPAVPSNPVFGQVTPPGQSAGTVAQEDLRLFEGPVGDGPAVDGMSVRTSEHVVAGRGRRSPARLRRQRVIVGTAALGVGAAAVIAVASGAFSSGNAPSRTVSATDDSAVPAPSGSVSSRSAAPSPGNGGAHATGSPGPSSSAASGTASASATAPASASVKSSSATPSAPAPTVSSAARPGSGTRVLSPGSHGGQVKDLQRRLTQLNLYTGPADGRYSTDVADAVHRYQVARGIDEDAGVYGPETRAALESETRGG